MTSRTQVVSLITLLSLASAAAAAQGSSKSGSQSATTREAAVQECRQIHGRTGKGSYDNTSIRVEQCVKEKLGKK